MYKTLALLKKPLENAGDIEGIVRTISEKIGLAYGGLKMGEYRSSIPIYCMIVKAQDYEFKINYHEGLGSFQSDQTKGFTRSDYHAKIEILGSEADPDMEYFNDFILVCENIEKRLDCVLVQYNKDSQLWEKL